MRRIAYLALPLFALATTPQAEARPRTAVKTTRPGGSKSAGRTGKVVKLAPKGKPIAPTQQVHSSESGPPMLGKAELERVTDLKLRDVNWATVSPLSPWKPGRAQMLMSRPSQVPSIGGLVVFNQRCPDGVSQSCTEGRVRLSIWAEEPAMYVVQCAFRQQASGNDEWVAETVGGGKATMIGVPGWNRLVFVVDAPVAGHAYEVWLTSTSPAWALEKCQINPAG